MVGKPGVRALGVSKRASVRTCRVECARNTLYAVHATKLALVIAINGTDTNDTLQVGGCSFPRWCQVLAVAACKRASERASERSTSQVPHDGMGWSEWH